MCAGRWSGEPGTSFITWCNCSVLRWRGQVMVGGEPSRWCQQCCTFHPVSHYDGARRYVHIPTALESASFYELAPAATCLVACPLGQCRCKGRAAEDDVMEPPRNGCRNCRARLVLRNERRRQSTVQKARNAAAAAASPQEKLSQPHHQSPLKRKRIPTHKGAPLPAIPAGPSILIIFEAPMHLQKLSPDVVLHGTDRAAASIACNGCQMYWMASLVNQWRGATRFADGSTFKVWVDIDLRL